MKEKGLLKDFWENFEEYLCSAALLVMTFVTFMNVFSRKITWFNMSFTQELVTTMFVWVCCLAAASVFKTDSHMGFNYLTDKFTGTKRKVYRICRLLLPRTPYTAVAEASFNTEMVSISSGSICAIGRSTPSISTKGLESFNEARPRINIVA